MTDAYLTRLHEFTIILYAISVLLYFFDFMHNNQKANRAAFWLLSFVWLLQTSFLLIYMVDTKRFPVLTIMEGLYFYTWVLVSFSLLINKLLKIDFIVFFTNVLGFIIMAIHTFAPMREGTEIATQVISELLLIHITAALLAYGGFSLSFIFSLLYCVQFNLLKKKIWGKRLRRIPDLTKLENIAYLFNVFSVPLLLIALILGIQWASVQAPGFVWYDPKILGSFLVLFIYGCCLYARVTHKLVGKGIAYFNIACFLILLINFFLAGNFSTFHYK
ncbi:cytochrome C assembly protein [Niallia circulans]|uniref:Cytochrome C assembly protein n=1 Tax=Niallia circulans TaxID=1397 RepID=A0A553SK69_NIACI|nr:cytochrome c biogenesis protein CcsA [Niallia circulans]TRZ37393.1 cytochrome C assembly protein [Niallia circulans]